MSYKDDLKKELNYREKHDACCDCVFSKVETIEGSNHTYRNCYISENGSMQVIDYGVCDYFKRKSVLKIKELSV